MKKQILACWNTPHQWKTKVEKRRQRKFHKKNNFEKSRAEKYKRKFITNKDFLEKLLIVQWKKIIVNVGHVEKENVIQMMQKLEEQHAY